MGSEMCIRDRLGGTEDATAPVPPLVFPPCLGASPQGPAAATTPVSSAERIRALHVLARKARQAVSQVAGQRQSGVESVTTRDDATGGKLSGSGGHAMWPHVFSTRPGDESSTLSFDACVVPW